MILRHITKMSLCCEVKSATCRGLASCSYVLLTRTVGCAAYWMQAAKWLLHIGTLTLPILWHSVSLYNFHGAMMMIFLRPSKWYHILVRNVIWHTDHKHRCRNARHRQKMRGKEWADYSAPSVIKICDVTMLWYLRYGKRTKYGYVASVVTVNRTETVVFCYLQASSPRCFRPKTARCLCVFNFFS